MDPQTWFKDITPFFVHTLLAATTGPLLFGFHLAELNAPEDVIRCKADSITSAASLPQCMAMTPAQWGLVGSIYTLGGFLGAVTSGTLSSKYGRRKVMLYNTAFFIIGPIFMALAPNLAVLSIGRFISGIGAGTSMVVAPLFVSEISPPAERGFFGACTQVMVNVGILIAQLLGFFLSRGQLWRIILAAGGVIGVVQTFGLLFSVESPKWMAIYGDVSLAKRNLRKVRGENYDISEEISTWVAESEDEANEHDTLLGGSESPSNVKQGEKQENLSIFQVWRHPIHRRAVFAVMMVMVAQQFTGINSIVMYGVGLLSSLLQSNSALLNLVVSALNIVVTAATAPLVDRLGRKVCLLNSITVMGVSSLLLAIGIIKSISILSAIATLTFVAGFALGLGPVPFVLASELVDPEAVGATQSLALSSNWISTFCVAQFFPILNEQLHGKVYFIFAGLALFFFLFVSWAIPESKGKKTADEVWGRDSRRAD